MRYNVIVLHILKSAQFDKECIDTIFSITDSLAETAPQVLAGKILASLFYEPSTRTRFSFESGMIRLGGNVIATENAKEFSSAFKGETLEDSVRVLSQYVDVIVLRHYEEGAAVRASVISSVPIINAGDGVGEHPTQALLDLYTIQKKRGAIDGSRIAFVGDLKHGRTVRSLAYLIAKYKDISIHFVSPKELRVREDIRVYLDQNGVTYTECEHINEIIGHVDVLYMTRIQKERFTVEETYGSVKDAYQLTATLAHSMMPGAIVMHPLPRVDEILPEVDMLPQAAYFDQAAYGQKVRMALLMYVLTSEQ